MDEGSPEENAFDQIIPIGDCADECLREAERVFGTNISQLKFLSYEDILLSVHPGIKTHFSDEGWPYHSVDKEISYHLSIQATGLREAFLMVREICARNVACGVEIPIEFRPMCSLIIRGERKFVTIRGRNPAPDFALKWTCIETADYLSDAFGIPLSRGDGFDPTSACDAVTEALTRRGIPMPYERVRDWLTHRKHRKTRDRARHLSAFMKDEILLSLGALSRRRDWVLNPFGQMMPFGRMR